MDGSSWFNCNEVMAGISEFNVRSRRPARRALIPIASGPSLGGGTGLRALRLAPCLARLALLGLMLTSSARAALQFDVFLGFDGIVPEASWFPVVCEVKNDGPPFKGIIEVSPGTYGEEQSRLLPVELPTGTLKRFVIPVFAGGHRYGAYGNWNVRLLDERHRVRAEPTSMPQIKTIASDVPLLGALARNIAGAPVIRQLPVQPSQQNDLQPLTARLQPQLFPDNALVLEGMRALYLNSDRVTLLRDTQVNALYGWLNAGGHLILGVEALTDINSTPWLKRLLPCDLTSIHTVQHHPELQEWLRSGPADGNQAEVQPANPAAALAARNAAAQAAAQAAIARRYGANPQPGRVRTVPNPAPAPATTPAGSTGNPFDEPLDFSFESAEMQAASGTVLEGDVLAGTRDAPLMITAPRGRGRITVLLFSPEREPFHSWKNAPSFWAKLIVVPANWYTAPPQNRDGGLSSDAVFGAMLDTRQVHKLPVEWLLLLLVVYLLVIGPLDQFWLKKIGKPMLTWITFPCYVVFFSLLIYFIGYKLRAGESEWNEMHLVDVLLNGDHAEMRGRTYASVYSPSNQRYALESQQKVATVRGEFSGMSMGGQTSERATVVQNGDSFKADIFVPVWTSQLFVTDWWQSAPVPLAVTVSPHANGWLVKVDNQTGKKLANTQIVIEDRIVSLGEFKPGENKSLEVTKTQGKSLADFLGTFNQQFHTVVEGRRQIFGSTERARVDDLPNGATAASFLSQMDTAQANYGQGYNSRFITPAGLDVMPFMEHGGAMFFAWAADSAPIKSILQFSPKRFHQNTLWRVPVIVK